ncbi:hypothetical protein AXF42_Ash020188 [Apostasia shenzhenica]|uniref:Uncharacterized protein n=1 Tax=Apostasia shenzhenica TaxID=1088818 RepID=A0A2H9ZVX4_9ASPA|nr:hypothetical protein AXF42_Ash020188 [Apostasia shenzhenica]
MKKRKNSTLPDDVESPDLTGDKNSGNLPLHSSDGTTKRESPLLNSDGFRNSTSVNLKEPKIYCPEKLGEYLPSKLMRDCLSISSSKQYGSGTQDMPASETISGYEEYGTFSFSTTLCDELLKKCSKQKNSADSVVNASKSQFLRLEFQQLAKEHKTFKERINKLEHKLQHDLQAERKKNEALTEQVEELEKKLKEADKEQETLIDIFSEERQRRDAEEEKLREQLKIRFHGAGGEVGAIKKGNGWYGGCKNGGSQEGMLKG